jgi:acetyl esterase/lipase
MHGGAYVTGTAQLDDRVCRAFADALDIVVASVDYRLAPEHPYPAALDDCDTALQYLAALPDVDPSRVAIGGVSSGAGLAAALAIRARDRGSVVPIHQLLLYPMLDDKSTTVYQPHAAQFRFWDVKSSTYSWKAYLGDADPQIAVPARCADLSNLPSAWIGVGSLDLFHDEDVAYAMRLRDAGVDCELHVVDGAFHGFDAVAMKTAVAYAFFAKQCASLGRAFAAR